jgi:hypothetical protein
MIDYRMATTAAAAHRQYMQQEGLTSKVWIPPAFPNAMSVSRRSPTYRPQPQAKPVMIGWPQLRTRLYRSAVAMPTIQIRLRSRPNCSQTCLDSGNCQRSPAMDHACIRRASRVCRTCVHSYLSRNCDGLPATMGSTPVAPTTAATIAPPDIHFCPGT